MIRWPCSSPIKTTPQRPIVLTIPLDDRLRQSLTDLGISVTDEQVTVPKWVMDYRFATRLWSARAYDTIQKAYLAQTGQEVRE